MNCDCNFHQRYELRSWEGAGGQSKVQRAFDRHRQLEVAIKIISQDFEPVQARAIWNREWQSLKRYKTRQIANLIDYGNTTEHGFLYIATEWLKESLQDRLDSGTRIKAIKEWRILGAGLAETVSLLHSSGVHHRDLKPGNVMFRTDNPDDWSPVLIDFGAASAGDSSTETVAQFHTPLYSPKNYLEAGGVARDVYAAAAMLSVVIGGPQPKSPAELIQGFRDQAESPIIGGHFHRVLGKALQPVATSFYKTADEFLDEFKEARKQDVRQRFANRKSSLNFVLTQQAHDDASRLSGHERNSNVDYLEDAFGGEFWIKFSEKSLSAGKAKDFVVLGGQLQLVAVTSKDDDTAKPFIVRSIKEIGASRFETLVSGLDELSGFFDLEIHHSRRVEVVDHSDTSTKLLSQLFAAQKKMASKGDPNGEMFLNKARSLIDARKKIALQKVPELTFEVVDHDRSYMQIKTSHLGEVPENANWQIEGPQYRKAFWELDSAEGDFLSMRASRPMDDIPPKGKLVPHLGLNEIAFERQIKSIDMMKEGTSVFDALPKLLSDPSHVSVFSSAGNLIDERLDTSKNEALNGALNSRDLFVVEGPPGTGKTEFIIALIREYLRREPFSRILLASQTNVAIDNVLERLPSDIASQTVRVAREESTAVSEVAVGFVIDQRLRVWREGVSNTSNAYIENLKNSHPGIDLQLKKLSLLLRLEKLLLEAEDFVVQLHQLQTTSTSEFVEIELDQLPQDKKWVADQIEEVRSELSKLNIDVRLVKTTSSAFVADAYQKLIDANPQLLPLKELMDIQSLWVSKFGTDDRLREVVIARAKVVAGTCVGFVREKTVEGLDFDLCIIDESSRATTNELLVPMSRARRVVLIGDTKQLPPNDEELLERPDILKQLELSNDDVRNTIFNDLVDRLPDSNKMLLDTQYRMSGEIGQLISDCFYESKLKTNYDQTRSPIRTLLGARVEWLDSSSPGVYFEDRSRLGSYLNTSEVEVAVRYLKVVSQILENHRSKFEKAVTVLVIAPYRAQVARLKSRIALLELSELLSVRIETLDAVQGLESDLSILSVTRSNPKGKLGFIGPEFWRRINVALSRGRHKLVIIGDSSTVRASQSRSDLPGLASVLAYIEAHPEVGRVQAAVSHEGELNA